jgi:hypothetical protein
MTGLVEMGSEWIDAHELVLMKSSYFYQEDSIPLYCLAESFESVQDLESRSQRKTAHRYRDTHYEMIKSS